MTFWIFKFHTRYIDTHAWWIGSLYVLYMARFLRHFLVKEFQNSVHICHNFNKTYLVSVFLDSRCIAVLMTDCCLLLYSGKWRIINGVIWRFFAAKWALFGIVDRSCWCKLIDYDAAIHRTEFVGPINFVIGCVTTQPTCVVNDRCIFAAVITHAFHSSPTLKMYCACGRAICLHSCLF